MGIERFPVRAGNAVKHKPGMTYSGLEVRLYLLKYFAAGSDNTSDLGDFVMLIIWSISAGVTTNGFFGKCFMFPVTRKESSTESATS